MKYRTYKPNPMLRDYVHYYWTMTLGAHENIFPPRGYADGYMNIIFSFADPLSLNLSGNGYAENALPASIYGNVEKFVDFKAAGRLDLFSVHFKPGGIFPFVEIPLFEFTNRFVDANLKKLVGHCLREWLFRSCSPHQRFQTPGWRFALLLCRIHPIFLALH
jgi:hypothetical protein